jgi:ABC-2 type transport system permease protein
VAMTATFLPAFLLSGFMVPIANMPVPIRAVTYLVPARYFVALLHAIYLKGVGMEIVALEAMLLTIFGAVMVAVAYVKFKKQLN